MNTQSEKSSRNVGGLSKGILQLADMSFNSMKKVIEGNANTIENIGMALGKIRIPGLSKSKEDCDCCAPKEKCPPGCLLNITRTGYEGERIVVYFKIKNKHYVNKSYRIGVRPLKDENGHTPLQQPVLNKTAVTLTPGESQSVALTIDLRDYLAGHVYKADIVIQENGKNINQNICFTLLVKSYDNIPEAQPRDVQKPMMHFQNWQTHFYCEPRSRAQSSVPIDTTQEK